MMINDGDEFDDEFGAQRVSGHVYTGNVDNLTFIL